VSSRLGPFERHVREAIALNLQRAPLYSDLSGGASEAVSRRLIRTERRILPLARWLARRAEPFERAGVPILEDVFVSMAQAPAFLELMSVAPSRAASAPSAGRTRQSVAAAFREDGFVGAAAVLDRELERIAVPAEHWCMYRHMLESALRICTLAGPHAQRAAGLGLPSPLWISRLLLRLHFLGLGEAVRLDSLAYPIQRRGIPILYRDLPTISPWP
jgi:hypothetical protein